jgi:hypothetical protein
MKGLSDEEFELLKQRLLERKRLTLDNVTKNKIRNQRKHKVNKPKGKLTLESVREALLKEERRKRNIDKHVLGIIREDEE